MLEARDTYALRALKDCSLVPYAADLFLSNVATLVAVLLQIVLCDQMASYLTGFLPKASAAPEAAAASSSSAAAAPEAGMKLVKKKGEDEEVDAMFTGLGGKKGAKGKGAKKAAKKAEEKKDTSLAKLPHSIDTLSAFSKLKVEVPVNATNIPTAIEALKVTRDPRTPSNNTVSLSLSLSLSRSLSLYLSSLH